ncbi:uncharacterized protein LOC127762503 [Oryza glaberrima]|nr:uncharacterized protein LOC127762503 [Oryza glaberrima]
MARPSAQGRRSSASSPPGGSGRSEPRRHRGQRARAVAQGPAVAAGKRLSFMNEYLAEDRDPVRCWVVAAAIANILYAVLDVGSVDDTPVELPKKLYIGPPSAKTIQLPDGRHLAYKEQGVTADRARFSLIAPHSFLSSRLARIPGIKPSLLEEFGARLVIIN